MKKIFFLTLAALMLPMMSFAQERIMVIADPHVIPQTEIDKQADFDTYMKTQRKMLELSEPLWHALLDTALKYKPDLVLIPGDLTKDGEAASHDTVSAGIHRLEAAGIPTLVIPGNHDIPGANWETLYSGTFKNAVKDAGSHSFASEPLPGVTVLGIDGSDGKASIGKLSAATLAWIEEQADAAKAKGNTIIAMTHWQILEHFDGLASIEPASRFEKPDELRDLLMHHGVHLVLTGHFHVNGITTFRDTTGLTQDSLVEITTGSPITYPCPYRWLTLAKDRKSISVTTEYITSLPGIDGDFNEYSREWMREHTTNLIPTLSRRLWKKIFDKWDEKIAPALDPFMAAFIKSTLPSTDEEQADVTKKWVGEPAINLYLFYSEASESRHPEKGKELADAMREGVIGLLTEVVLMKDLAEELYENELQADAEEPIQSLVEDKTLRSTAHADVTDDLELLIGKLDPSIVAKAVDDKISAIGTVAYTDASKALIDAARAAYNALTADQKALVTKLATLEAAEKAYADLKAAAEKAAADQAAAKAADDKISAIGTVAYTDASKALIDAARSAYNALTAEQKALVTKLSTLEAAEKAYADLKAAAEKAAADQAAAKAVDDKISAIGTVAYTDASKALIDAARAAYNALTADQKALVTKLATLEAAEKAYADLKAAADKAAADQAAAKAVDDKIGAIGKVAYTDASKALIDAARSAYNALTAEQKALVANLATLEAAEKAYADLKAAAEKAAADQAAAKAVDDKIDAIGTVEYTDASKALIDAARAAYNALTADQKALVANLSTLEAAEKAYADLKAAAEKAAADEAAAKAVDDKIDAIGTVEYTDASKALIDAARAAYNALTADQKALVANISTLEAAEKAYADLKAAAESPTAIDDIQSSDINIQKVLRDGKVYFLVGEKIYDATGRLVK
ncbi:MAG: metallophosphoesterase [Paludibacteraceae bacterium]|nr:metallophosphoesterase [Paludibacteraceae bacterium]